MTTALIIRDDSRRDVSFTDGALELRAAVLEQASMIGRVATVLERDSAVDAQRNIMTTLKACEDARKQCKEPVLQFSRVIDDRSKEFIEPLKLEQIRIATLVGTYEELERVKARAAESARNAELTRLERERESAIAAATTEKQIDDIREKAAEAAKDIPIYVPPPRAKGQVVSEGWVIDQIREWELADAHPHLVSKIEFNILKLKALLDIQDGKVKGVKAHKAVASTVRAGTLKAIDV